MADVRALLRQQRQSRRIEHPHAAYSDAGKLLCTVCREQIRAESLWPSHIKSTDHQRRAATASAAPEMVQAPESDTYDEKQQAEDEEELKPPPTASSTAAAPEDEDFNRSSVIESEQASTTTITARTQSHKRKISDEIDDDAMDLDEAVRRKKSRANMSVDIKAANDRRDSSDRDADGQPLPRRDSNRTPPTLARRMSSTPSRGVELQIPSRPATPAHRDSSSSSTAGGSALAGLTAASAAVAAQASHAPSATNGTIATQKLSGGTGQVDEDEWAAFEADMAVTAAPYDDDAVISAPAMNAEESAAATAAANGEGEGAGSRKSRADLDIEGEREDATRALEDEFDDMQELEARVKRLKEKREELRKRAESIGQESGGPVEQTVPETEAEKRVSVENGTKEDAVDDDEDDDDEDDEEDDWDGFRFRR